MSGPFGSSQWMYASGAEEGQSLRVAYGDNPDLTRTNTSAPTNNSKGTFSCWIKRGLLGSGTGNSQYIIHTGTGTSDNTHMDLKFGTSDQISIGAYSTTPFTGTAVFRDPSAWYHIVVAFDSTSATAADRQIKVYINGEETAGTKGAVAQNQQFPWINQSQEINIFRHVSVNRPYDGYIANVCMIDGQALTPTSFGEYDDTLWKPKSDSDITGNLTFGTNGFYLPFKQTTEAEGFSTVTYTGNGGTQSIEGVGFEPDLVWIKSRNNGSAWHSLIDSVRGVTKFLYSNTTSAEATSSVPFKSLDSSGFTVASDTSTSRTNVSGENYVAWCWDAGSGSATSNTDGSITSTVKANTAKGFSIVSYTGTGANATIGHGLSSTPEMYMVKNRDQTGDWCVYHKDSNATPEDYYLLLNLTNAAIDNSTIWNDTAPTSTTFSIGSYLYGNNIDYIAYCFHSVSGYSSIGSYTGTGSSGNSITGLGFKPAFLLIKRADISDGWIIHDNTRSPSDTSDNVLFPNTSGAEATNASYTVDFDADGFTLQTTNTGWNASGGTYIYMAFADTRDATFFGDTSGNSNNWTPNALNNTDVMLDSPVTGGNFCTLNQVSNSDSVSLKEGSLEFTADTSSRNVQGTMAVSSGKWYFEARMLSGGSAANGYNVGVATAGCANITTNPSAASGGIPSGEALNAVDSRQVFYSNDGGTNTITSNSTAFEAGDIIGVALDLDSATQTVSFYKNGTIIGSAQTLAHQDDTWLPHLYSASVTNTPRIMNFGQDSSFAGAKTPQGNTDDNGVGDFYYAPPSGYLALTTGNLDAPAITAPDDYFNTVLYSGNSSTQSITGVGFQPDWVWLKGRSTAYDHQVYDSVRGATERLKPNLTDAESTQSTGLTSFDTDGFSLGSLGGINNSSNTYVAWNWLASNSTSSNTDGSVTSTVSANQTAGFSVVGWASQSGTYTVGHGLSSAPELIITKSRTTAGSNWWTFTTVIDGSLDYLALNTTGAKANDTFSTASPTATTFGIGSDYVYTSGDNIAYCFHSVEGYSKISSYTGNGSSDGPFVHCGFRPAWIMIKQYSASGEHWEISDVERGPYNLNTRNLYANLSNAEGGNAARYDVLSNGFKIRTTNAGVNASGGGYIFLAFAESPFSKSNAR